LVDVGDTGEVRTLKGGSDGPLENSRITIARTDPRDKTDRELRPLFH
jgi:hypothetical protein